MGISGWFRSELQGSEFIFSLHNIFFLVQMPNSNLRHIVVEAYGLFINTRTRDRFLWSSDQLVLEAATYPTHNKHKRRTSIPWDSNPLSQASDCLSPSRLYN